MSTTGEHPAAAAAPALKPLEVLARSLLGDVKLLVGVVGFLVVTIFGGGWVALAQVRDAGHEAAREQTAGITTEQAALKANVRDLREEVADVKSEVRELRRDLRTLFPRLPEIDGGR